MNVIVIGGGWGGVAATLEVASLQSRNSAAGTHGFPSGNGSGRRHYAQ